jgi:endonuclease-3
MDKKAQVAEILTKLKKEYTGKPSTVLHFSTPLELLVATIMSAQTTDVLVNKVTEVLFKKYKSPEDFARSTPEQIAQDIKPVNFYNTKAKNIHKMANLLMEKFGGNVPKTMQELVTLPGVARKTANIVLSSAFGINEGIAVDTHVTRLSVRLGLTKQKDPVKIEQDLIAATPKPEWNNLAYLLIFHGRAVCHAKKPKHGECVLFDICPSRSI